MRAGRTFQIKSQIEIRFGNLKAHARRRRRRRRSSEMFYESHQLACASREMIFHIFPLVAVVVAVFLARVQLGLRFIWALILTIFGRASCCLLTGGLWAEVLPFLSFTLR